MLQKVNTKPPSSQQSIHWTWNGPIVRSAKAAVIDIDGVVSEASGRQHFLEGPKKQWREFFEACVEDPVIEETRVLLDHLSEDLCVVLLTARPAWVHGKTLAWLEHNKLRWNALLMKGYRDQRPSVDYKRAALIEIREHSLTPICAIEDDPRNVAMFRSEGVPCLYRHSGYYG